MHALLFLFALLAAAPISNAASQRGAPDQNEDLVPPPKAFRNDNTLIFFDLEGTGLPRDPDFPDITQIAAVSGEHTFNVYVMPSKPIEPIASQVTGLTVQGGRLFYHDKEVPAINIHEALLKFNDFVSQFHDPILVAHNGLGYDIPITMHHLRRQNMLEEFSSHVYGILDSKQLARKVLTESDFPGNEVSYHQQDLVRIFLEKEYEAHDASADAAALQDLFLAKLSQDHDILEANMYSFKH